MFSIFEKLKGLKHLQLSFSNMYILLLLYIVCCFLLYYYYYILLYSFEILCYLM